MGKLPMGRKRLTDTNLAKSRALARARALENDPGAPPNIGMHFVKPPDQGSNDCHRATCRVHGEREDREWLRREGESSEDFERRVFDDLPMGGLPKLVLFLPDD